MKNEVANRYCRRPLRKRNLLFLCVLLSILHWGCSNSSRNPSSQETTARVAENGWELLFDGKHLDSWEITGFGTQGPVQVTNGSISLGMGDGCTGVTWKGSFPRVNYEIKLEAKKVSGNDFFCGVTFPVEDTYCSFIAGGWGGPVVGLSTIDGKDASENETRILKKFEHNQWYQIHLKVTQEKIEAWIDNEQVVDFNTQGRQLSIRPEVNLSRPFGICSWTTTAEIRNIRLKRIN